MNPQTPFRVLVTRPAPQGQALCDYLEERGYETLFLPVIEIQALADTRLLLEQLKNLDHYDWAIFVSRSAVQQAANLLHEQWPQLPPKLQFAAIGEGTAAALKQASLPLASYPLTDWRSEGLLSLPAFQNCSAKKIAIFCGQGGRQLLAKTLIERGAQVTLFISYQRVLPTLDLKPCLAALMPAPAGIQEPETQKKLQAIICTSVESVQNLKKLFDAQAWSLLKKIPLVLISERIMIQAKELGFESCWLAKAPTPLALLEALNRIRKERP